MYTFTHCHTPSESAIPSPSSTIRSVMMFISSCARVAGLQRPPCASVRGDGLSAQFHGDRADERLQARRARIIPHRLLPGTRFGRAWPDRHGDLLAVISQNTKLSSEWRLSDRRTSFADGVTGRGRGSPRSHEPFTDEHLTRLVKIALEDQEGLFERNPHLDKAYRNRLLSHRSLPGWGAAFCGLQERNENCFQLHVPAAGSLRRPS